MSQKSEPDSTLRAMRDCLREREEYIQRLIERIVELEKEKSHENR